MVNLKPKILILSSLFNARFFVPLPLFLQKVFRRTQVTVRYSTIFALIIILALGPLAYIRLRKPSSAEAAWFDDSWMYRKKIEIANSGSAQTDFQVKTLANFDMSSEVSAGKVQTDFDDLRFTDINGQLLDYWIEDSTSSSLDAWVKVPSIPTSGATVYLYYGNPSAPNAQNGDKVFEFFDDFNGSGINSSKWTFGGTGNGATSVSGGEATITKPATGATRYYYTQKSIIASNHILSIKVKANDTNRNDMMVYHTGIGGSTRYLASAVMNDWGLFYSDGSTVWTLASHDTSYHVYQFKKYSTNVDISFDSSLIGTYTLPSVNTLHIGSAVNNYTSNATYDWIYIRKYTSTEPSAGTPSDEEQTPGPLAYWSFDSGYGTVAQDATQNKNDGTISGATWQAEDQCLSGKCLYFDGTNDSVGVSKTISGVKTVSFWVRPNSITSSALIDLDGGTHKITVSSGTISASGFDNPTIYINGLTSTTLSANSWQYISVTTATSFNTNSSLTMGKSSSTYLQGFLDEVKIYPYARSAAQVKTDYLRGSTAEGASVVLGSQTSQGDFLSQGLVGYWKMDENSGNNTTDSSGNGLSGSVTAGTVISSGKFSNTRDFNSANTEGVIVSDNDLLEINATNSYSGFAWIKPDSVSTYYSVFHKRHGGCSEGYNFSLRTNATIELNMVENSVTYNTKSTATVTTSDWAFVGFTIDRTTNKATVYVNSQPSGTPADITNMIDMSNTCPFYISSWGPLGNGYFDGKIDEVRFYNRALSPAEVQDLYNWAPGPLGYWKMDEDSGQTAYDVSGNGIDEVLGSSSNPDDNDPSWVQGKFGSALKFDGNNDYVKSSVDDPLDLGMKNFTLMAWVKHPLTSAYRGIFVKGASGAVGYALLIANNGLLDLGIQSNSNTHIQSSIRVDDNQWHHCAVVANRDGNAVHYIDGVERGKSSIVSQNGSIDNSNNGYIGSHLGTTFYNLGLIDEVKIYNYARSPKQIVEDMKGGSPSANSGSQVLYLRFDEGAENTCSGGTNDVCNSGNGGITLDGTSTATRTNQGKIDKALEFDGTDDVVTVTNSTAIDLNNNLASGSAFTAWVWADSSGEGGNGQIFWKGNSTYLRVSGQSGNNLNIDASLGLTTAATLSLTAPITTNAWNHLAMTWSDDSDDEITLWVNGKNMGSSVNGSGTPAAESNNLLIGGTTTANFDGKIDEFKVYSSELTEDEIRLDMNQGKAMVMGAISTSDDGKTASFSAERAYCIPGDTTSCSAPAGEWKLDEKSGSTAYDTSGNGKNLLVKSSHTWVSGKYGNALKFTSSSDDRAEIAVSSGDSLDNITNAVTMEGWIYPRSTTVNDLFGFTGYNPRWGYSFVGNGSNRKGVLRYQNINGDWVTPETTNVMFTPNVWQHVGFTYDGTTVKFYKNGTLFDSKPGNGVTTTNAGRAFAVGGKLGWNPSDVVIDQVRVFNYVRTPAQIAWDYNRGGPIGHWKFDECQGATAYDSSGNGNNGTITIGGTGTQDGIGTCTDGDTSNTRYNGLNGKYNSSLKFDGTDDYVSINYTNPVTATSVFAWFKKLGTPTGGYHIITGGQNVEISINTSGYIRTGVTTATQSRQVFNSGSGLTDGNWHQVGMTYDGNNLKSFIDGIQTASNPVSGNLSGIAQEIGRYLSNSYVTNGLIDDVRIYGYALTQEQIKQVYNENSAIRFGPSTGAP